MYVHVSETFLIQDQAPLSPPSYTSSNPIDGAIFRCCRQDVCWLVEVVRTMLARRWGSSETISFLEKGAILAG